MYLLYKWLNDLHLLIIFGKYYYVVGVYMYFRHSYRYFRISVLMCKVLVMFNWSFIKKDYYKNTWISSSTSIYLPMYLQCLLSKCNTVCHIKPVIEIKYTYNLLNVFFVIIFLIVREINNFRQVSWSNI